LIKRAIEFQKSVPLHGVQVNRTAVFIDTDVDFNIAPFDFGQAFGTAPKTMEIENSGICNRVKISLLKARGQP